MTCTLSYPNCRSHQCSWGSEPVKRANSREYVQSLQSRIEELVKYASFLELNLERCRTHHGLIEGHDHIRPDMGSPVVDGQNFDFNPSDNEDDLVEQMRAFHVNTTIQNGTFAQQLHK